MTAGRIMVALVLASALAAGVGLWWLQVHAFYRPGLFTPGAEVVLAPLAGGEPEAIPVAEVRGIDSDRSPIRFRACFTFAPPLADIAARFAPYPDAVPLVAPGWFDCFDAAAIGAALERGEATAFLSRAGARPDVDLVVALFPDGRGYAWTQLAPGAAEGRRP
jgi:hypothetical protein